MVNKFFYIKGGSETYYFSLRQMLIKHGHEVIDFSMKDPRNFASEYEEYFVENIDYDDRNFRHNVKSMMKIVYSFEARHKFQKLIEDSQPDLIHLHLFQHQISPSILDIIKKYKIPVVYTAHDLKMVCLNYKMRTHNRICEKCIHKRFYNCFLHKCVKDSYLKSLVNMVEGYYHSIRKSYDVIDLIITPSMFYKQKLVHFGIDEKRISYIPNFVSDDSCKVEVSEIKGAYYLYFGRLSEEKGIHTLINAFGEIDATLYIVGTGPLYDDISKYVTLYKHSNIHILGFKNGDELSSLVKNSKAVIIPSEWYENGPYSAIEALQLSRPIIGANIGGIPELVNENGYLFESGNADDLRTQILRFETLDESEYRHMALKSYEIFSNTYKENTHYDLLMSAYKNAILKNDSKKRR